MSSDRDLNKPEREKNDIDLKHFLHRYGRYWYLFLISFVLAFASAKYYNWYKNPVYGVSAKLLVKDESGTKDRVLRQLEVEAPAKNIENEIEILRSHNLLSKTFAELDFDVSYFLIGNVKISEVYKDCPFEVEIRNLDFQAYFSRFNVDILDANSINFHYELGDGNTFSQKVNFGEELDFGLGRIILRKRSNFPSDLIENPSYDKRNYIISFNTINYNQNRYLSKLQVALSRSQSTILQLYMEDEVPQKAVDFINKLIEVYLRNDVDIKNTSASATAEFLDEQLAQISSDLESIETSREDYKVRKGIVDLESESQLILESLKKVDAERSENNARLSMIRYLGESVAENDGVEDIAPSAMDLNDPLLVKLINKLSELQSERENILKTATVNDPRLVPLKAEIDLTRASLVENIRNIERGLERKEAEYAAEVERYRGRIQNIPGTERELLQIERRFRVQESLYTFLMEKRAELSITLAATESDTRLIDQARVLPGPISPVPGKAYSVAILLAIIIPVLLIYLLEKLNDKVMDGRTISRLTNIPVLGAVGFNSSSDPVVSLNARSSIAEQYRSLRTNLKFFNTGSNTEVVMVTSSVGTEGKTFTAMNLSAVIAASGQKVVLLGMDLRKPRIVEDLEISNELGCSNFLSGNAGLDEVIQRSQKIKGLDIIPSGPIPPNPSELILSAKMTEMVEELKQRYDKIIIDTPPIGLVSDGLMLSEMADVIVFVVRQGVTRKDHVRSIDDLYTSGKMPKLAIVFNAVKKSAAGYGYGGGHGYGYAYGSNYGGGYYDDDSDSGYFGNRLKNFFDRKK